MQRSSITGLVFFAVLGAVYYFLVHQFTRVPFGADLVLAAACAGFALLFLSGLVGLLTSGQQTAAFQRAEGNEPLQDGRLEVVTGAAQPTAEPLISPLQH